MKNIVIVLVVLVLLVAGFFAFNNFIYNQKQADAPAVEDGSGAE